MKRIYKGIGILLLIFVVAIASLGAVIYIHPYIRFQQDLAEQRERVAALKENSAAPIDEQSFVDFDLSLAKDIKYNEIQTLITHNSYKKNMWKFGYNLLSVFADVEGFHYEHDKLSEQFNHGVRGVELDIRYRKGRFIIYHVDTIDTGSHCPDWLLTLEEMKIWSDNNPGHIPISVLVEVKEDALSAEMLQELDDSVRNVMGNDKLITPSLLMGDNKTLRNVAARNDWVSLREALGKFMFILHPHDDAVQRYISLDPTMRTQALVPMFAYKDYAKGNPAFTDYFLLIKYDKLVVDTVQPLINSGFMVRVRMDGPDNYKEGNQSLAVSTGAQIISTDFEPGVVYPVIDYRATLREGKTVSLSKNLIHQPYGEA
ncbi:MAG: Ca2+-dependent phosphoinositide-specific phospholipase C [Clostridia bacterium]|nr:Ca2+-dependent phosphoinositide-specific phospholipase C [Clostridia bacterium]